MRSRFYTVEDVTMTLGEWCREFGVPYFRTYMRIKRGMTFTEAITKPRGSLAKARKRHPHERYGNITIGGRTLSLASWCAETGITSSTAYHRIARGWKIEEAVLARSHQELTRCGGWPLLLRRMASQP